MSSQESVSVQEEDSSQSPVVVKVENLSKNFGPLKTLDGAIIRDEEIKLTMAVRARK